MGDAGRKVTKNAKETGSQQLVSAKGNHAGRRRFGPTATATAAQRDERSVQSDACAAAATVRPRR